MPAKKRVTAVPCVVRTGTANSLTQWKNFDSEQRARSAIVKFLSEWKEFAATRQGAAGADVVLEAISAVAGLPINKHGSMVSCEVDPYTHMILVAEVAHGTWDPKSKRVV